MTLTSTSDATSIFKEGKLKPGIYKIQNLFADSYLDIHRHSKEVCCRPARDLEDGRGLWEIGNLGIGYAVKAVDPGKPDQFCNPMEGTGGGAQLFVIEYPAAWRIDKVDDEMHRGFEYVRFFWGPTNKTWDMEWPQEPNGARVKIHECGGHGGQTWRLIPVKVEGTSTPSQILSETLGSDALPSYDGDTAGQRPAQAQHTAYEYDGFGTVVTEVTTITTRKRYRLEDA